MNDWLSMEGNRGLFYSHVVKKYLGTVNILCKFIEDATKWNELVSHRLTAETMTRKGAQAGPQV